MCIIMRWVQDGGKLVTNLGAHNRESCIRSWFDLGQVHLDTNTGRGQVPDGPSGFFLFVGGPKNESIVFCLRSKPALPIPPLVFFSPVRWSVTFMAMTLSSMRTAACTVGEGSAVAEVPIILISPSWIWNSVYPVLLHTVVVSAPLVSPVDACSSTVPYLDINEDINTLRMIP